VKKLYVGNIPYSMTEQQLSDLFVGFGAVEEAKVIIDRESGRSKGFAFVSMADPAAADKASADLNGKEVGGRKIVVNEAREKKPRTDFDQR
jgi:cold-inducible RNA-binding protein